MSESGSPDGVSLTVRAVALIATAVIGNAYWRLHRERIQPAGEQYREPLAEGKADPFWGQTATIWARWTVVVAGAVVVLSQASDQGELAIGILPVVVLLIANFYLHGRHLVKSQRMRA
ncbi:MAG: hypothetical protein JOZ87_24790 [Chloroflexi bacterium]|nr:hypothetical protein [Chloroflexota bacterium]